jgi:hypothetical protein
MKLWGGNKMNGTSFQRPYVPDECKKIVGPLEDNIDDGLMTKAILQAAMAVSVLGGAACFAYAVILKVW